MSLLYSHILQYSMAIRTFAMVHKGNLGGGFKYFLFSPLFGEDYHFD